jgi:16S rRNA (cytosine967-C5)-methyltransferase
VTTALAVEYSCPEPLVESLLNDYGEDYAVSFLENSLERRKTFIRVNNTRITDADLSAAFAAAGVRAEVHQLVSGCLAADSLKTLDNNPLFEAGYYHIQDLSSQLCCLALSPGKGDTVLDICAAPGGKTFTMSQMVGQNGVIYACDLRESRVGLIKSGTERLGLENIITAVNDAVIHNSSFPMFDKILCDVPCSGFGVIARKPEIKYADLSALSGLPDLQHKILSASSRYLKNGGELVYSTCTLSKKENDGVIDRFLTENPAFEGIPFLSGTEGPFGNYKATIFPEHFGSDGFFIAKIKRTS